MEQARSEACQRSLDDGRNKVKRRDCEYDDALAAWWPAAPLHSLHALHAFHAWALGCSWCEEEEDGEEEGEEEDDEEEAG